MSEDSDDRTRSYVQLASGTAIGRHRLIKTIGAGGMGEVYLAEDLELNRKVALKFLPAHLCQDPDCRARFKREAQAAAKLDHPSIVSVFDVGEFHGRPFIAMQHIEGQSLKEVLSAKAQSLDRVCEIGIQVCNGLQAAHDQGIIHRDIKPSNILIDTHGRARIVDFGLAAIKGTDHLTKTGSTLGTVGYMSPEQVRGEELDHRTDIFSLGVVLYESVTGRQPFRGDTDAATSRNITDAEPEPLTRYKSGVSAELQRIISKALAKDRSLRYQHADDLATDLQPLVSTSGQQAIPPTANRKLVAFVLSLAFLSLVVIGFVLKPWRLVWPEATTQRIVVVPFQNQTGDPTLDPLGKMVADWTTQSLLGTGLVEVVPPEALLQMDANKGSGSVAEATGASMIVTGSYYKLGDSLQFQAKLSAADNKLLEAIEPLYSPVAKPMEGIEAVRQRLLGAVATLLDETFSTSLRGGRPPTYEAYQEYIQARDDFVRLNNMGDALEHATKAFALDTSFYAPLFLAADCYYNLGRRSEADSVSQFLSVRQTRLTPLQQLRLESNTASNEGDWARALDAARRSAKLAPGPGFEYEIGWAAIRSNRPREAIKAFKRMDPNVVWFRNWQPYWYEFQGAYHLVGEYEEGLKIAQHGRERFPTSIGLLNAEIEALVALGRFDEVNKRVEEVLTWAFRPGASSAGGVMRNAAEELRAHGHEAEAMAFLERAIGWYQSRPADELKRLRTGYASTLYAARRWAEAKVIYEEFAKESPGNLAYQASLGLIAARQHDRATALKISDWLKDLKTPYLHGGNTYNRACIAAVLGDKEQAVALLKESFQQGMGFSIYLHRDFDFESLWDYPPFKEVLTPKG